MYIRDSSRHGRHVYLVLYFGVRLLLLSPALSAAVGVICHLTFCVWPQHYYRGSMLLS